MKHRVAMSRLLVLLIVYSFLVFLWGAWVRISGSGDGCGEHWPFCYGVLIPESTELKLIIENFHRVSTKIYGFFVIGLMGLIFYSTSKAHAARKWILWTFIFTLIEGLIGAIIVLKGLVTDDDSLVRAVMISVHLANTFLLMASVALTWFVTHFELPNFEFRPLRGRRYALIGASLILIGGLGALAALSTTLFPSTTLLEGLAKDLAADSHFLLKIRALHPLAAIALFISVLTWSPDLPTGDQFGAKTLFWFKAIFLVNILVGFFTLGLLSPTVLKLTHLLLGHMLWLSLILLWAHQQRLGVDLDKTH